MFQFEQNMLIEGDNLRGLKLIEGLVNYDLVLITSPHREDKGIEDSEKEGKDVWSSELKERLKKAHSLLKRDGTIAIHVKEKEYATLRLLMDDVFGKHNYLNTFISKGGENTKSQVERATDAFEFLVVYKKSHEFYYKNPYKNFIGGREKGHLKYFNEKVHRSKAYKGYRTKLTFKDQLELCNEKQGRSLSVVRTWAGSPDHWIAPSDRVVMDTNDMKIQGWDAVRSVDMVKGIISIFTDENSKVLDFYAGSGATGQAVMELNREDGGKRQFTLMTNNERNICKPRINEVARANGETYQCIVLG